MARRRKALFYAPPAAGMVVLVFALGGLKPAALGMLLAPVLLYLLLFGFGRAPDWLARLLLSLLVFVALVRGMYALLLWLMPAVVAGHPVMPFGQIVFSFITAGILTSGWRFAYRLQPGGPHERGYLAKLLLPLVVGIAYFLIATALQ